MATKMINVTALAAALGVSGEALMTRLGIDTSIDRAEAVDMFKDLISVPNTSREEFEAFCWLAGHFVEEVSV